MSTTFAQDPLAAEQRDSLLCRTQFEQEHTQLRAAAPACSELVNYITLLEQAPLPAWVAQEQRIIFVNAALCAWIEAAPEQLVGSPLADLFRAVPPARSGPCPGPAMADREEASLVCCRAWRDGDLRVTTWSCPVPEGQPLQVGLVGLARPSRAAEPRCASEAYLG